MTETFSVIQYFPGDTYDVVAAGLDAKAAVELAKDYSERPAAKIGIIRRITIIDSGDCIVFDWRNGEGVVFPTADMRRSAQEAKATP